MFAPKIKRTPLRGLAYDAGAHLQTKIREYFTLEMNRRVDRTNEQEGEKGLEKKRKILTATARAVNCFALPQVEFGDIILLQILIHDDKKIDDIIKLFFNNIRKQNSPTTESRIVLNALREVSKNFFFFLLEHKN